MPSVVSHCCCFWPPIPKIRASSCRSQSIPYIRAARIATANKCKTIHLSLYFSTFICEYIRAKAKAYLLMKDITARPSLAICTHTLVQLTSILHLRWNIYVQNIKYACENKPTLFPFFHCNQVSMRTYFSIVWCVSQPTNNMPKYIEPIAKTKWKNP